MKILCKVNKIEVTDSPIVNIGVGLAVTEKNNQLAWVYIQLAFKTDPGYKIGQELTFTIEGQINER